MTQTPPSGPPGPLTTPPISSLSMATAVWAPSRAGVETGTAAMATTATLEYNTRIIRTSLLGQLTVTAVVSGNDPMRTSYENPFQTRGPPRSFTYRQDRRRPVIHSRKRPIRDEGRFSIQRLDLH